MYAKFIVLDIKAHFICGESNLHGNKINWQNIMAKIADVTLFKLDYMILSDVDIIEMNQSILKLLEENDYLGRIPSENISFC